MISYETRAVIFLSAVAVITLAWFVSIFLRQGLTPIQWGLYHVNSLLVRFMWRAVFPRSTPIPKGEGAVVISNHRSSIDPNFILPSLHGRFIHVMVAQIYKRRSFIGWFMHHCDIIPVKRKGPDTQATKIAIRHAEEGRIVGMFPEGRINHTDDLMVSVRPGAILVALKARVPILPCYVEGSQSQDNPVDLVLIPMRVKVNVGRLIDLSDFYDHHRDRRVVAWLTIQCVKEIAKLAGRPDFEPQLAGRNWKSWQDDKIGE